MAAPISASSYVAGFGLSRLFYVAPVLLLWFGIAVALQVLPPGLGALALLVLFSSWLTGCAIRFVLAAHISEMSTMSSAANLFGLAMAILPPVLYPIDMLSGGYSAYSLLLPSVSAAHLLRIIGNATAYDSLAYAAAAVCSVALWTGLCGLLAVCRGRWRE